MTVEVELPRRLFTVGEYHRIEPQPDLLLLRPREVFYSRELPTSQDVLLAVEVVDTTVRIVATIDGT